jgi:muconolactone delta-isomerase
MEVHHHPHLPHGEKKKFKEYFLEFLMIFLAVTLGFFAENVREHFDEEKTTKQYLEDFRQELLQNKDLYQRYDRLFAQKIPATDSLTHIFINKKENDDLLTTARLISFTRQVFVSTISKAAYDQMVNSGGLKYIHDAAFRDSLTIYERGIYDFQKYNEIVDDYRSDAFPDISSIEPLYSMLSILPIAGYKNVPITPFAKLTQKERTEILNFYNIYLVRYESDKIIAHRLNKMNDGLLKMLDIMLNK